MGNSPRELRSAIDAVVKELHSFDNLVRQYANELHKLLRDAPWEQDNQGVRPEHAPRQEYNGAHGEPPLLPKINPSPRNPPQTTNSWYKTFNGWKTRCEVAAIIGGLFYAWVTYRQWRDLRENFIGEERAWLRVLVDLAPGVIEGNSISIHMKNLGKSVAEEVIVNAKFEIVDYDKAPSFDLSGPLMRTYSGFIFPTDEYPTTVPIHITNTGYSGPSETEMKRLKSGDSYMAVYGIASYADPVSPKKHWTRFCSWNLATDPKVLHSANAKACTDWNAFGDGMPPKR